MLKKMVIVVTIVFSLVYSNDGSIPEWVISTPKKEGRMFGIGIGDLMMKAILLSLADLETQFKSINSASTDQNISTYRTTSGGELLKKPFKLDVISEYWADNGAESFRKFIMLTFTGQGQSSIEYFYEDRIIGSKETIIKDHLEATYSGLDETKLIKHLQEQGFDLEYVFGEEIYYVKIGVDTPSPLILTD